MKFIEEFKDFAMRGNLVDLAIGFTVGAAFSTVAKSLVNDIIMPPIGLLLGRVDFSDLFIVMKQGKEELPPYSTVADAQAAGAVTLNYGLFVNSIVTLSLIALAMFFIVKLMNRVDKSLEEALDHGEVETPTNKKCPHCRTTIAYKATRCPNCTSELELPPEVSAAS